MRSPGLPVRHPCGLPDGCPTRPGLLEPGLHVPGWRAGDRAVVGSSQLVPPRRLPDRHHANTGSPSLPARQCKNWARRRSVRIARIPGPSGRPVQSPDGWGYFGGLTVMRILSSARMARVDPALTCEALDLPAQVRAHSAITLVSAPSPVMVARATASLRICDQPAPRRRRQELGAPPGPPAAAP